MPRPQLRLAIEVAARALTDAAAELATDEANEPTLPAGPDLSVYHRLARDEPDALTPERRLWQWDVGTRHAEIGLTAGGWLYVQIGRQLRALPPTAWAQLAANAPGKRIEGDTDGV